MTTDEMMEMASKLVELSQEQWNESTMMDEVMDSVAASQDARHLADAARVLRAWAARVEKGKR